MPSKYFCTETYKHIEHFISNFLWMTCYAVSIYENNNNSISETTTSMWLCLTIYAKLRTTVSLDTSRRADMATGSQAPNILRGMKEPHIIHIPNTMFVIIREESTIFTHKIVCFVIIFDLLRLAILSYKQEENLCILRRRDVLRFFSVFCSNYIGAFYFIVSHTINFRVNEKGKTKPFNKS